MLLRVPVQASVDAETWVRHTITNFFNNPEFIATGDVDGNGDTDLVVASTDAVSVWLRDGTNWSRVDVTPDAGGVTSLDVADLNGDSDPDLLLTLEFDHELRWYENLGGGVAWTARVIAASFTGGASATAADIDDDGDLDVVATAKWLTEVEWWENSNGAANVWIRHDVATGLSFPGPVEVADLNGDGDHDIICTFTSDDEIRWYQSHSATGWTGRLLADDRISDAQLHTADVNGDGRLDVLAAGGNFCNWWENSSAAGTNWIFHTIDQSSLSSVGPVRGQDVDADGDVDLVLSYADRLAWAENRQGRGTDCPMHVIGDMSSARDSGMIDVDGDGDLDLIGASYQDDEIAWWENRMARRGAVRLTPFIEWSRAWGSTSDDGLSRNTPGSDCGITVDTNGYTYVTGFTSGEFHGQTNAGGAADFCVIKADADGDPVWTRFRGAGDAEYGRDVAVDSSGNVYVCGHTTGAFDGQADPTPFRDDFFLTKFDAGGTHLWTRIWGTEDLDARNQAVSVAVDQHGNAYVVGYRVSFEDPGRVVLTKYSPSGGQLWRTMWGNEIPRGLDAPYGMTIDVSNSVYVAGIFDDSASDYDGFLSRVSPTGAVLWTQTMGSNTGTHASGVTTDSTGGVYVVGHTVDGFDGVANTNASSSIFAAKYSDSGAQDWLNIWGPHNSYGIGIDRDSFGNILIVGSTSTGFDGQTGNRWFVSKLAPDGNRYWTRIWGGVAGTDPAYDVAVHSGAIHVYGAAYNRFDGQVVSGGLDMAVSKWIDPNQDNDAMADKWESTFFGDLSRDGTGDFDSEGIIDQDEFAKYSNPVRADSDHDGANDYEECVAGTDLLDSTDQFVIDEIIRGDTVVISWQSVTGRLYDVNCATSPSSPWAAVPGQTNLPGTGGTMSYSNALPAGGRKYYKLQVRLPN